MVPRGGGTRRCGALTPGLRPSTEHSEDTRACGFGPVGCEGKACQPVGVTTTCILPALGAAVPHGAPAPPGPHYPQASVCRSVPVCIPGSWAPLGPCPPRRAGGWMLGVAGPTWANYQLTPALPCPAALSQLDTPPALFCRPGVCERLHGLQCTHTQAHTHLHIQYRHSQIEAHAHTHTAQQLWAEPQSDQVSMELSWGGQGDLSAPSLWWGRIVPMGRG